MCARRQFEGEGVAEMLAFPFPNIPEDILKTH
jgi:hypothetical protein